MKKVFLLLAMFAMTAVFASEADIKKMITDFRTADAEFQLKALDYLAEDFSGVILGITLDKYKMKNAYLAMSAMMSTHDLEVFTENALRMQEQKLDAETRAKIREMKNTEQGKNMLKMGKEQVAYMQKMAKEGLKVMSFKEIKINGSLADVTLEFLEPTSAKMFQCKYSLVKKNGKWLIKTMQLDMAK